MQFEINHNVTEKVCKVTFINPHKIGRFGWTQLDETFKYLGANQCDDASYLFPSFITSQVIQEIINNTCFVCGGLMKDGIAIVNNKIVVESFDSIADTYEGTIEYLDNTSVKQITVRKCTSCGHSHT